VKIMAYEIVGIFASYGEAEAAVLDLEQAGIVGGQVEVISDIDEDVRTANTPGEPSTKLREPSHSRVARLFGAGSAQEKPEPRDVPGEQPNYIGDQEFYANHLRQGGAIIIVRPSGEQSAARAAEILKEHGARAPGTKDAPSVRRVTGAGG
jgi:hypothetical protein